MWNYRLGTLPIVGTIECGVVILFAVKLRRHWVPMPELDLAFGLVLATAMLLLVVSSVWTFVVWVGARPGTKERIHNRAVFIISLLTASIVGLLMLIDIRLARGLPAGSFVRPFDEAIWRQPDSSQYQFGDITERQKMLGSVIDEIVLNGDRAIIMSTLGPSDNTNGFSELGPELIYKLGAVPLLVSLSDVWLLIWFDDSGHTLRYELRTYGVPGSFIRGAER